MRNNYEAILYALILVLLASPLATNAQRSLPFYSADDEAQRRNAADKAVAAIVQQFQPPAKFDKKAQKIYLEQRADIEREVGDAVRYEALFDDVLLPFVQSVHDKILAANPGLPATHIILTADPTPNAYSVGSGTLVVFTGLLSELENEDQLAFVICHEIAHFTLRHATDQLAKDVAFFQSKEFKKKIEDIEDAEYNQIEKIEQLLQRTRFKARHHRRDLERQADSLAFQYFSRTNYDMRQSLRLMDLFEYIDQPMRDSALQLERHFGCSAHPYQPKWAEKPNKSIWGATVEASKETREKMADSLSTHPDSRNRRLWLAQMIEKTEVAVHAPTTEGYGQIKLLSALENVQSLYNYGRLDVAIYRILLYQKQYPNNTYFSDMLSICLGGIFQYLNKHKLQEVVVPTSPYYEKRYNDLLQVLNNLRLPDLVALQGCILGEVAQCEREYQFLAAHQYFFQKGDKTRAEQLKQQYLAAYPKGRFVQRFVSEK